MNEAEWIIAAMIVIALGYLLLKFGQAIAKFLLALGGLIVAGIIGLALLEQARATRAVAATASIAATGQAATSATLSAAVVFILFLLLVGGGVAVYLVLRQRRHRTKMAWLPGPYAYWQVGPQAGTSTLPAPPAYPYPPTAPYLPAQPYPPYLAYPPGYPPGPWSVAYLTWPPAVPDEPPRGEPPLAAWPQEEEDDDPLALPWW